MCMFSMSVTHLRIWFQTFESYEESWLNKTCTAGSIKFGIANGFDSSSRPKQPLCLYRMSIFYDKLVFQISLKFDNMRVSYWAKSHRMMTEGRNDGLAGNNINRLNFLRLVGGGGLGRRSINSYAKMYCNERVVDTCILDYAAVMCKIRQPGHVLSFFFSEARRHYNPHCGRM